jgi:hypothetical protein
MKQAFSGSSIGGFSLPYRSSESYSTLNRRDGSVQSIQKSTAESYYKGLYPDEVDAALIDLLDGKFTLDQTANRVNLSLKKKVL